LFFIVRHLNVAVQQLFCLNISN